MQQQYVLTLIGNDKPGLVDSLAQVVKLHGGNWLESRMANLSGKFSGIVLVSVAASEGSAFKLAIENLKNQGISVRATEVEPSDQGERYTRNLTLLANDRPGILSELTATLASLQINVEELTTDCAPAPMSSELLFKATARVGIPDTLEDAALREALEALADDLMVEIDQA